MGADGDIDLAFRQIGYTGLQFLRVRKRLNISIRTGKD